MNTLSIDIETFSDIDIKKAGAYRYTQSPAFQIMLFAYSFNSAPVQILDLFEDFMPDNVLAALTDPGIMKFAYNASFERTCIARELKLELPPEQWTCTMVKAAMAGLPFGLGSVASALRMDKGKMTEGKELIKYFCMPCKPTGVNKGRTRNMPWDAPQKWEQFKQYCIRDVEVEQQIGSALSYYDIPAREKALWALDQRINDRGILLDPVLIDSALKMAEQHTANLLTEARQLTGLSNPNSTQQLTSWLEAEGMEVAGLTKASVKNLLADTTPGSDGARVLQIRQELAKTSNKKYTAMQHCYGEDGRARGLLQFCGAGRTWRWAGRLIQVQNLTKSTLESEDLGLSRELVKAGDMDTVGLLYDNIPNTLSGLIRSAFIASPGKRLLGADLSAIEARVLAWLANETWRLNVFNTHGKIYEASGAAMFKIPIEWVTKTSTYRQRSKVAELALGYQGSVGALLSMGAIEMGIPEEDLQGLVDAWRRANKKIVQYWYDIQDIAIRCVTERVTINSRHGIIFHCANNTLFVTLPSGRKLAYVNPVIRPGKFGPSLWYMGVNSMTKTWGLESTYGGKLVENLTQAIARDVLAEGMLRVAAAGYEIVMHVHDEIVAERELGIGSVAEVVQLMSDPIPWAKGLPLGAEGFEAPYYKK